MISYSSYDHHQSMEGKSCNKSNSSSSTNPKRNMMMMSNSLPPGFRFHPTDEELIVYYLKNQATSKPCPISIIPEVDIYKFDPWQLPEKADFGEKEWYFFTPRDRKYPNGVRPNRATVSGYWKATGTDKAIYSAARYVGIKKALVFYKGRPPKGTKTDWIMHEYRLNDASRPPPLQQHNNTHQMRSMRLDDWVLCRIYRKRHAGGRTSTMMMMDDELDQDNKMKPSPPPQQVAADVSLQPQNQGHPMMMSGGGGGDDESNKFPRTFSLAHLLELDHYNLGPISNILINDHVNNMVQPSLYDQYHTNVSSSSNSIHGNPFESLGNLGSSTHQNRNKQN